MGKPPCCEKNAVKKGPWSTEEDNILIDYIQKHSHGRWRTLPKNAGLKRCGKSCRLRWTNYLRPDIKRGRFSPEEEDVIIQLHGVLGNKWSAIAAQLPGRTDNEIKNFWNTHIKKKLLRMGIDPVTHAPHLDLQDFNSILALYNYSHQSTPCLAPLYNSNMGNHPSYANFAYEGRLSNTSACSFPGFCERGADYAQENNTFQININGCEKVQNYGRVRSSLLSPSTTTAYVSSRNIGNAEITEGYHDHSSVNYDFSNGLYINGLI